MNYKSIHEINWEKVKEIKNTKIKFKEIYINKKFSDKND